MKTADFSGSYSAQRLPITSGNRMLQALAPAILSQLIPHMERIELRRDEVLAEAHSSMSRVHFIEHGLALFTKMMSDGRSTMTASVGREGMTMPNMLSGARRTGVECVVLIPGTALSIDRSVLFGLALKSPQLGYLLQQYSLFMNEQITQISACNRLHSLEQRYARFLLTVHQNAEGRPFTLTQEMMAITLGAQRPHISVVATQFRKKNLIEYRHGQMQVINAERLRLASCECHDILKESAEEIYLPASNSHSSCHLFHEGMFFESGCARPR
jgi:CRP-like cAMP-binding protein